MTTPLKPGPGRPAKPEGEGAGGYLQLRIAHRRKSAYVRAANGRKLSQWVTEHLDKAAGYSE